MRSSPSSRPSRRRGSRRCPATGGRADVAQMERATPANPQPPPHIAVSRNQGACRRSSRSPPPPPPPPPGPPPRRQGGGSVRRERRAVEGSIARLFGDLFSPE